MDRLQDRLVWTNRYPLNVSIPRTETATSAIRLRHATYLIEVDDCGKIYTRHRRFTNFVWLHGELRRRELGFDLPELPPKKVIGNMDPGFIERRRLALENYLQKLLHLPLVVQDDTIWAFLDADLATAAVPRFLCRPRSQVADTECLITLERVLAKQANVFRFCNDAVTRELVEFAKAEADSDREVLSSNRSVPSSSSNRSVASSSHTRSVPSRQAMRTKLQNRIRFCNLLQPLFKHERARQGMVELGMFGALIKLLARSVEDNEASVDETFSEDCRRICVASRDNLQALLEVSNGAALLNFCQQDDGLSTLRRIANGNDSLHQICASLLWHGLQNKDVVDALVGSAHDSGSRPGLTLLGGLLKSTDLRARVLSALCVSVVVRHEGALAEEDCIYCLEAIRPVTQELDSIENDSIEKLASNDLQRVSMSFVSSLFSLDRSSLVKPTLIIDRDPDFVKQLKALCCAKDLPRLLPLLGHWGGIDEVTSLVVVLLDNFVQQFAEEPAMLRELGILAEPLQRIVEMEDEISTIEEGSQALQATWVSQIRIRVAQILIRLDWPKNGEVAGDPHDLKTFFQRAKILEVLNGYSTICQEKARHQLDAARTQRMHFDAIVSVGGLTQGLCIGEARLNRFAFDISSLEAKRRTLKQEVEYSTKAVDDMHENLERHGIKNVQLKSDIDAIYQSIIDDGDLISRSDSAQEVARYENILKEIWAQVNQREAERNAIEADIREKDGRQRMAETEWKELQRRETELAEVCDTALARLQPVQDSLRECERHRIEISETSEKLASALRHGEHRLTALQRTKEEAEGALKKVHDMKAKLEAFQEELTSEIVLTDAEADKLRDFDVELQPSRPVRLRKSSELSVESTEGDADESAPSWEDMTGEQEFYSAPHLRSFAKLYVERREHWEAELAWAEERLADTRATVVDATKNMSLADQQLAQVKDEEARLQDQERTIADFDGHALRHAEAEKFASEAHELYLHMTTETAEASNALQMTTALLEDAQSEKFQADIDLNKACEIERAEMARFAQASADLESRTKELEGWTRGFLQEWHNVALEEHRLNLLLNRVVVQLQEEARGRICLREEARRLIAELQNLDRQLEDVSELNYDIGLNAFAG